MARGESLKLRSLEDLDRLTGAQLHDGLLPTRADALELTAALRLGGDADHVDARNLDLEELLERWPGAVTRLSGSGTNAVTGLACNR